MFNVEVAVALLNDGIRDCIWDKNNGSLIVPTVSKTTQEMKRTTKLEVKSEAIIAKKPKT